MVKICYVNQPFEDGLWLMLESEKISMHQIES